MYAARPLPPVTCQPSCAGPGSSHYQVQVRSVVTRVHVSPRLQVATSTPRVHVVQHGPAPATGQLQLQLGPGALPSVVQQLRRPAAAAPSCHQLTELVQPASHRVVVQQGPHRVRVYRAPEVQQRFAELPPELLQEIADWLPTFGGRALLRALCAATRGLEWRHAAPFHVEEELSGLGLGDVGCLAIAAGLRVPRNASLKELCLGANGITDHGARCLAAVLQLPGTRVRRLSLRDNCIGDAGAAALAQALATSATLEELDLWGNCLSASGQLAIMGAARACEVFLELPKLSLQPALVRWPRSVDASTRTVLFDWLGQVHQGIATSIETVPDPQNMLFRTFSHLDAFLAQTPVQSDQLELAGLACVLTAGGLAPRGGAEAPSAECTEMASWLAFLTDGACTAEDVCTAGREVYVALGGSLHQPTVYTFLRRYLRQTGWTEASFSLANYLLELTALDAAFCQFRPQVLAAAAAVLCRQYVSQAVDVRSLPRWKARLLRCADVQLRQELAPCVAAMSRVHAAQQPEGKSLFVHQKYTSSRVCAVARVRANPPADVSFFEQYMLAE